MFDTEKLDDYGSMDLTPVDSSCIAAIGYDEDTSVLVIEFLTGAKYIYMDVEQDIYDEILAAPSRGHYFWEYIRIPKGPYDYERIN